ncbi:MAG: NAD(P)-binding domain-containing protein [Synechococcales cyanobacterium]
MQIGILGAGRLGSRLGQRWATAGHQVMLSSRDPAGARIQSILRECGPNAQAGTVQETLAFGSVIVLALEWEHVAEVVSHAGDWQGKIVIDATNRFTPAAQSGAEEIAAMIPQAHVVKALNTVGAKHLETGSLMGEQISMFIAGDHPPAKAIVRQLVEELGLAVVDVGHLSAAGLVEQLAHLWVALAFGTHGQRLGPDIAFRLIQGPSVPDTEIQG